MLKTNLSHKIATMQQITYVPLGRKFCLHLHQCDDSRGEGETELACGCMMPVVAGALSLCSSAYGALQICLWLWTG